MRIKVYLFSESTHKKKRAHRVRDKIQYVIYVYLSLFLSLHLIPRLIMLSLLRSFAFLCIDQRLCTEYSAMILLLCNVWHNILPKNRHWAVAACCKGWHWDQWISCVFTYTETKRFTAWRSDEEAIVPHLLASPSSIENAACNERVITSFIKLPARKSPIIESVCAHISPCHRNNW